MNGKDHESHEALKAILRDNQTLVEQIRRRTAELDQMFAARKDILKGSRSTIQARPKPAAPHSAPCGSPQPPVIIVVEDNADDFMLLKRALYKAGATARLWWAHEGEEALSILAELEQSCPVICVVMDVRLFGMDGFELLDRVKQRKGPARIKCAFLTGMVDQSTQDRAAAHGADGFFIKPPNPADLIQIARALQKLALSAVN